MFEAIKNLFRSEEEKVESKLRESLSLAKSQLHQYESEFENAKHGANCCRERIARLESKLNGDTYNIVQTVAGDLYSLSEAITKASVK